MASSVRLDRRQELAVTGVNAQEVLNVLRRERGGSRDLGSPGWAGLALCLGCRRRAFRSLISTSSPLSGALSESLCPCVWLISATGLHIPFDLYWECKLPNRHFGDLLRFSA